MASQFTFLFTDIEGSTRLWEQFPEEMHDALTKHDEIMREAATGQGGDIFRTAGDAFFVAFERPLDAVVAAGNALVNLEKSTHPQIGVIKVRMAIYTGQARQRDNDYFGPALNRVSRLLALATGGHALMGQATADAIRDDLPTEFTLTDLGEHELRDIENPERVYQIAHPALPTTIGIKELKVPNNLPNDWTSFIGREKERYEITMLLRANSLVSLIGAGGCGKSRLALQVARENIHKFEKDGVWFVELAPVADPSLVAATIADLLGVAEEPGVPILQTLCAFVRDRQLLLILDNCEHLIETCASISDALLRASPQIKILVTSREALGIGGEKTWRVPSLSLPDPDEPATSLMESSEAVRLFVERATGSQANFELNAQNAPAVASICRRLDGIPLAIELAAARVKALTVDQISTRLDDRFRLLTGGSRTALPRQQTLRAAIDWSYNLLGEHEKALLLRLAVFAGGWTLEAAETVCAGDPIDEYEVLDLLTQLLDKSLVNAEDLGGQSRYTFLETVRQYAREKLFDSLEGISLRQKHSVYFRQIAVDAKWKFEGPELPVWVQRHTREHDNFRAALEWACNDNAVDSLWLVWGLVRFWEIKGFYSEGRQWLERALAVPGAESEEDLRMRVYNGLGNLCREMGDFSAAEQNFQAALELAIKLDYQAGIAILYNNIGILRLNLGRTPEAIDYLERSIDLCRKMGDKRNLGGALSNMCEALAFSARYDEARAAFTEALQIMKSEDDPRGTGILLMQSADLEWRCGNLDAARAAVESALPFARKIDHRIGLASGMEMLGKIAHASGDDHRAAVMFGATKALREKIGTVMPAHSIQELESQIQAVRESLGLDEFDRLNREGRMMSVNEALDYGLAKVAAT